MREIETVTELSVAVFLEKDMAELFVGLAVFCLIYYLVIIKYAGITADFAWIWIAMAGFMGIFGCTLKYNSEFPNSKITLLLYGVAGLLFIGSSIFLCITGLILKAMFFKSSDDLEYVIILGAQVKGKKPSKALIKRMDQAILYKKRNPEVILILSGGQGDGEFISEAECMQQYLMNKGISIEEMRKEEKSTNTKENLLFSDTLTGCAKKKTGIISNNFHIYRAIALSKKLGYEKVQGIPAPSDWIMQIHYIVREVFALIKEILKHNI